MGGTQIYRERTTVHDGCNIIFGFSNSFQIEIYLLNPLAIQVTFLGFNIIMILVFARAHLAYNSIYW